MNLESIFAVHKLVKYLWLFLSHKVVWKSLSKQSTIQQRKEMTAKIADALKDDIKVLKTEFQKILIDDMVTAFQNRMNVLKHIQERHGS